MVQEIKKYGRTPYNQIEVFRAQAKRIFTAASSGLDPYQTKLLFFACELMADVSDCPDNLVAFANQGTWWLHSLVIEELLVPPSALIRFYLSKEMRDAQPLYCNTCILVAFRLWARLLDVAPAQSALRKTLFEALCLHGTNLEVECLRGFCKSRVSEQALL